MLFLSMLLSTAFVLYGIPALCILDVRPKAIVAFWVCVTRR